MNRDLGIPAESSDHPAETNSSTMENVHLDNRQRNEAAEPARRVIESLLHAEPLEDAADTYESYIAQAEQAAAREEYPEAERLYYNAWCALPQEQRNDARMCLTFAPLIALYRTQQRKAEADALLHQLRDASEQYWQEWYANHPSVESMLDKHLTPQWLKEVLADLPRFLRGLRQTDPINAYLDNYWMLHKDGSKGEEALSLKDVCELIDEYAYLINLCCHAAKAREHTLKAFLIGTSGIKAKCHAEAAERVRANTEARNELRYYQGNFGSLTCRLVNIGGLIAILKRDLIGLSQVDRAKLEQYEAIYVSLMENDEEEWERFPIVELLDIAEAYLPGMQRDYRAIWPTRKG